MNAAAQANAQLGRDAFNWYSNYYQNTVAPLQQKQTDLADKLTTEQWVEVIETAHGVGLRGAAWRGACLRHSAVAVHAPILAPYRRCQSAPSREYRVLISGGEGPGGRLARRG